jgi:hypothetical protein
LAGKFGVIIRTEFGRGTAEAKTAMSPLSLSRMLNDCQFLLPAANVQRAFCAWDRSILTTFSFCFAGGETPNSISEPEIFKKQDLPIAAKVVSEATGIEFRTAARLTVIGFITRLAQNQCYR